MFVHYPVKSMYVTSVSFRSLLDPQINGGTQASPRVSTSKFIKSKNSNSKKEVVKFDSLMINVPFVEVLTYFVT